MADRARVLEALYAAVDELNLQRARADHLEKSEDTPLTGDGARLDSLGFLNLILGAETHVNARCAPPVNLTERLLEEGESGLPATLGALASFIVVLQRP
jgi:hypothetical protein